MIHANSNNREKNDMDYIKATTDLLRHPKCRRAIVRQQKRLRRR